MDTNKENTDDSFGGFDFNKLPHGITPEKLRAYAIHVASLMKVLEHCSNYGFDKVPPKLLAVTLYQYLRSSTSIIAHPTLAKAFEMMKFFALAEYRAQQTGATFVLIGEADMREFLEDLGKMMKYEEANEAEVLLRKEGFIK